jgi:inner membrane protein
MASVGHIAVGMAAGRAWAGRKSRGATSAMLAFSMLSVLPDADVLGMALGIPYGAPWGHRGATHSILVAVLLGVGAACLLVLPARRTAGARVAALRSASLFAVAVAASHGVLDAMTDGGKGVAFFWPISVRRVFFPWRPIPVAPIGLGLISLEGLSVVLWELLVFSPLLAFALWPRRDAVS